MATLAVIASLTIAGFVFPSAAYTFLDASYLDTKDAEKDLLAELEAASGSGETRERLDKLEASLKPMFVSLPKDRDGNLDHVVVRYALHRQFLQKHGWFIRGLEPSGENPSDTPSPKNLSEQVPSFLQDVIEHRLNHDVDLRHLTVLAATLEDLIHKEAVARLEAVYETLAISTTDQMDTKTSNDVLETYLMVYLMGGNISAVSPGELRRKRSVFMQKYPDWDQVAKWMHGVEKETGGAWMHGGTIVEQNAVGTDGKLNFAGAVKVVEEIGNRFGTFNDGECTDLKKQLFSLERSSKPGRVRLADFYNASMHSHWKFNEKIDYLRALGALDDSNPKQLHVIVPNYVGSRPNCLRSSNLYEVCCRNECEDLMGRLERSIAGPTSTPSRISQLVERLSSPTVQAPRTLSPALLRRLSQVAESNAGKVPLHGRLFAQWMHHAFPRECPFPHTKTTSPLTPDEWMAVHGEADTEESEETMMMHVSVGASGDVSVSETGDDFELPWIGEEILLVSEVAEVVDSRRPQDVALQQLKQSSSWFFTTFIILLLIGSVAFLVGSIFFLGCAGASPTSNSPPSKTEATSTVDWHMVGMLLLLTLGAFAIALVHEFASGILTLGDAAGIAFICCIVGALMVLVIYSLTEVINKDSPQRAAMTVV